MATEIVGVTLSFITLIILIVNYFKTRHTERMALINSGRTAKIFDSNDTESNKSLKTGLFLLSVGLGLLAGMVIDNILDTEPAGVFVCILIFGGFSLIYYHNYVERKGKASRIEEDDIV
ncbi:MAG: hypothetical protein KAX53_07245 [Saprospiraceae bacterium]|jgi:F0F1-type ATP synthase assembly protein I|nr:hypothetical protein [Saprospiraceae bacterium]MBK7698098.1 hypothetical protein [Saprospiraceae bacterium]MBK8827535.1 hypothetical protein [Saprospiraceae bacterium]MBK8885253.1 hypothetical protein [Saprospiraceae bacterium]MBK9583390.1 hypothetical protein [Saprospiraceae bacterium]